MTLQSNLALLKTNTSSKAKVNSLLEKLGSKSKLLTEEEVQLFNENGLEVVAVDIAKECMSAMVDSVPPAFCWKSGGDFGKIPTGCPANYFRFLAMCYENCRPGYSFILGVCYKNCDAGYADHGLSCYKNLFRWYFKSSYISHILTNFSDKVPCPGNRYRFGALCYRDCELIGMYNCGIGACVSEKEGCLAQIGDMALKVLEGIGTGISTVLSGGAASAAKSAAKTGIKVAIKKAGKTALKASTKALKKIFTGKFKKRILQKAKNKLKTMVKNELKDFLKDTVKEASRNAVIQTVCGKVWESAVNKASSAPEIGDISDTFVDNLVGGLDVLGVGNMVKSCGNTSQDGGLDCAKSVVEGLSAFDPTGLLTIASAFMHPSCDVPEVAIPEDPVETKELDAAEVEKILKQQKETEKKHVAEIQKSSSEDQKKLTEQELINSVPAKCIWVWVKTNFQGRKWEFCSSQKVLGRDLNDKIESFIIGKDINGVFFEHWDYQGKYVPFTKGIAMKDVNNFKSGQVTLKGLMSSFYIGDDILFSFKWEETYPFNLFLTPQTKKYDFKSLAKSLLRRDRAFSKKEKAENIAVNMYFKTGTVALKFSDNSEKVVKQSTSFSIDDIPNDKVVLSSIELR